MNTTYNKMGHIRCMAGHIQNACMKRIHLRTRVKHFKHYAHHDYEKYGEHYEQTVKDLLLLSSEIRYRKQQIKQL